MNIINDSDLLVSLIRNRYQASDKDNLYESYVTRLVKRGLPPILSFRHLADTLGVDRKTLHGLALQTHLFYKKFSIPKRSGGQRQIVAPNTLLDSIQRWIGINILAIAFDSFSPNVVGYLPNKSILDHVKPHIASSSLIKFDLKDFFTSISLIEVKAIFLELGYVNSVAKILASLVCYNGYLPQGASTSPLISNIYLRNFDADLAHFCERHAFVYTRYADDIVVSGGLKLPDRLREIKFIFSNNRLTINHKKTRVYKDPSKARFVTGLMLNCGVIRLPKEMRRRIRVQSHLFLKELERLASDQRPLYPGFVPSSWRDKELILDPMFAERIIGKLNYWIHIEPENAYATEMWRLIQDKLNALEA